MFAREDYPAYFGDFPAPLTVLSKAVLRYKTIISGVFAIETEDHQRYVVVTFPIWSELSNFTMEMAERAEDKNYVFFEERIGCLALFELSEAHSEITKSPVIDPAAMMNAIWKYYPEYALLYNVAEQRGQHDVLSGVLGLLGIDTEPVAFLEKMIALSHNSNCDYIRM